MRLNWNNIGKGLEAIAGAKQARDLAQTSARYDVTEGAYGPGLQENIQQLEGLREQDPAQAAAYDQAIGELTRRQGLTAPDYSVASGPTNFATRQEARQAAAPLRAEGLAGAYRQYGDIAQADALEARAQEMQRGLMQEKRAQTAEERAAAAEADRVARRPLEIKQLENALVSQGLTIAEAQRVAAEQVSITSAREKLQTLRKDGPLTAAAISSVAGEFKLDPTKFLQAEDAVNTLEIKDLKRNLSSAALKGEDGLNKFLADKFDPDKTDNIKPMITKAKDGSFVVTYGNQVLQEYGAHKNMMSLVGGVINMIDQNPFATLTTLSTLDTQAQARKASEAAVRASDATVGLKNAQMKMFTDQAAGNAEAQQIRAKFTALPPEEQVGPKGQGLMRDFNMANAKAGVAVPLGAAPRTERTTLSPADVTTRAKALFEARTPSLSNPKKPMTMTEAIAYVEGGMRNPIADRLDAALGGGGDPFAPSAAGGATQQPGGLTRPAAAPTAAPAPRQTGSMGVDTSRARTDINPVTNLPREAPVSVPNLVNAATRGLDAGQARYVAYLEAKIAARERLTPDETARAKRFGLVP